MKLPLIATLRARIGGIFRRRQPDPAVVLAAALVELARTYVPGGYTTIQVVADRTSVEISGCCDEQRVPLLAVALIAALEGERIVLERVRAQAAVAGQGRWL